MTHRVLLSVLIVLAASSLPAFSLYAQEEGMSDSGTTSDASSQATGTAVTPAGAAPGENSTSSTLVQPGASGTLEAATTSPSTVRPNTASPTPVTSASVVPATAEPIATATSAMPVIPESFDFTLYLAGFTALAVSLGTYMILKKTKFPSTPQPNTDDVVPNDTCSQVYAHLVEKKTAQQGVEKGISIQEILLEKATKKLKEKQAAIQKDIEAKAKDVLLGKKDSTEARKAFDTVEQAKKDFDQAKEDVEKIKKAIEDLRTLWKNYTDDVGALEVAYQTCSASFSAASAAGALGASIKIPHFSNGTITLVPVAEKDISTLIGIEKSVAGTKIYSAMVEEGEWKEAIANEKVFLVQDDGRDIGDVSYEIKGDEVYISGLALIPASQGRGIGKQVLEILFAYDDFKKAKKITLVTHPENTAAITLYTSFGFVVGERRENYFGDGEPRVELVRTH